MLADSHFDKPLTKAYPPCDKAIAEPDLASPPSVASAQDRCRNADGRSVYRTVTVDECHSDRWIVHVSMNAT